MQHVFKQLRQTDRQTDRRLNQASYDKQRLELDMAHGTNIIGNESPQEMKNISMIPALYLQALVLQFVGSERGGCMQRELTRTGDHFAAQQT